MLFRKLIAGCIGITVLLANSADIKERSSWITSDTNLTTTSNPSGLKYFKFYESLPENIVLEIIKKMDLSRFAGKKIYIAYGAVDAKNDLNGSIASKYCRYFPDINKTVCLPWWRVEREYFVKDNSSVSDKIRLALEDIKKTIHPPKLVTVCKDWDDPEYIPGGKVSCVTYYDRYKNESCYHNPLQAQCYVDTCSPNVRNKCEYIGAISAPNDTLNWAEDRERSGGEQVERVDARVKVQTHQFNCPGGYNIHNIGCKNKVNVMMEPYQCTEDDEPYYVYCNENSPVFDASGNITGFSGGFCPPGKRGSWVPADGKVMCLANKLSRVEKVCVKPEYEEKISTNIVSQEVTRTYQDYEVSVLSGEIDRYESKNNCVRINTIEEARDQLIYAKMVGSGSLDDDIYVLRHRADGSHYKVYCNMQHNENRGNKKAYNGEILQCIDNNGNYSFNDIIEIQANDIVSVQQNSENENSNGTPFVLGRKHYGSTELHIDNVLVAPKTFPAQYPYYPRNGSWLKTWDNATSTLSLLFPFAGAYNIYFYSTTDYSSGTPINKPYPKLMAKATLSTEDFKTLGSGYKQLKLARSMVLNDGYAEGDYSNACTEDDWVEWGGGVYGGKSKTGGSCYSPNNSYVKSNSVDLVIVEDLLTGVVTPIPLVYPLPYPNRVFVSKLNVYENRRYRCFDEFPQISPVE